MVTVAVPPAHPIGVVTTALAVIGVASATSIVPVTGAHPEASVTLQASPVPAATFVKTPVALVTPLSI